MPTIRDIPTPALLLDLDVLEGNLRAMARRSAELDVSLRPHLKTHKCVEVARMQAELGARGATVSTLYEAEVFADHGFDDLTWAFPVIPGRIARAAELAERITLRLVVDSQRAIDALETALHPFHVWLKVDCGYGRAGVDPASPRAVALARRLVASSRLVFDGILTHSGHAYEAGGPSEIAAIAAQERDVMVGLADRIRSEGLDVPRVSVGSTPAMSRVESLEGVSEARPGNYAFYDFTQVSLGSCRPGDCALTVLSTVVSAPPGGERCVSDAGALSLSMDPGPAGVDPPSMGRVYEDYQQGSLRGDLRLVSLSQEHGKLAGPAEVGERVRILPNHSCLAAACFDEYHVVRGDEVVDRWTVWRGRD